MQGGNLLGQFAPSLPDGMYLYLAAEENQIQVLTDAGQGGMDKLGNGACGFQSWSALIITTTRLVANTSC